MALTLHAIRPSRLRGTAFLLALLAGAPALAQRNSLEESGVTRDRGDAPPVQDKAFDCGAFKQAIAAAPDGFAALRAERRSDSDGLATYAVAAPLFGACEIVEKKKIGEISYSCQAEKLSLADLKATVEACLRDKAVAYAANENPNTPFLRYDVAVGGKQARIVVLKTFGKQTLAIFAPK